MGFQDFCCMVRYGQDVYLSNRWPLVHCRLEDEEVAPPLSQIDLQRSAG